MKIRVGTPSDRNWVAEIIGRHFVTARIVSRGVLHDTRSFPFLIAEEGGQPVGVAHYHITEMRCELVTLVAANPRQGIGRHLIRESVLSAEKNGCSYLWAITTNDNQVAQRFFEILGVRLVAIHRRALGRSRTLKPEIPDTRADGMAIEDEREYQMLLPANGGAVPPRLIALVEWVARPLLEEGGDVSVCGEPTSLLSSSRSPSVLSPKVRRPCRKWGVRV